jgi:glyoxylase-like metal-dependent hydrolase (beta-lactamase superfamily II)
VPPLRDTDPTVVFCGDRVEESGDPAVGPESDTAQWAVTLDRVLTVGRPDAVYVPGHGAVVDAEFVRLQQRWLRRL